MPSAVTPSALATVAGLLTAAAAVMLGWAARPLSAARAVVPRWTDGGTSTGRWRRVGRKRPRPATDTDIAAWCRAAAASVRGGHSLGRAIADAGVAVPTAAPAFDGVLRAVTRGRALAEAIAVLDDDPRRPVGLVRPVIATCAELGGPAAAPLDRVAAVLDARAAEREERQAASAQARLSARVLTTLPVGTLALLATVEPSVRAAAGTSAGLLCIAGGAVCNGLGWIWMRRILARAV